VEVTVIPSDRADCPQVWGPPTRFLVLVGGLHVGLVGGLADPPTVGKGLFRGGWPLGFDFIPPKGGSLLGSVLSNNLGVALPRAGVSGGSFPPEGPGVPLFGRAHIT